MTEPDYPYPKKPREPAESAILVPPQMLPKPPSSPPLLSNPIPTKFLPSTPKKKRPMGTVHTSPKKKV